MTWSLEWPVLILSLLLAIVTIQASNLKVAVIAMGAFSLILSIQYLLLAAPDVALAEAAIGSTLSTVLLLVALSRYKVFHICLIDSKTADPEAERIIRQIEGYCAGADLDVHLVRSTTGLPHALRAYRHDLVIARDGDKLVLYGRERHYRIAELDRYLAGQAGNTQLVWKNVLH
jgi:uncharacterized MnhB-related membrane protein